MSAALLPAHARGRRGKPVAARALAVAAVLGALAGSCLPSDTRKPPGEVLLTASSGELTRSGFVTDDGWNVEFQRVLVSLGRSGIADQGARCEDYSTPSYVRLFDATKLPGPTKVCSAFGLGRCILGFRLEPPYDNSVVSLGASQSDLEQMRKPGNDALVRGVGTAVLVLGRATQGERALDFSWPFRESVQFMRCTAEGGDPEGFELRSEAHLRANVELHAEALFQNSTDHAQARLLFDPFASADADADGHVTLEEVHQVSLASLGAPSVYGPPPIDRDLLFGSNCMLPDSTQSVPKTLLEYLTCYLVPAMARFEGTGRCQTQSESFPRQDGYDDGL